MTFKKIKDFFVKYFFNPKWRCNSCGKEIFEGEYFCDSCLRNLPYNDKVFCNHCGRKLKVYAEYCSTCREELLSVDKARSVFDYDKPISSLIKRAKYDKRLYLLDMFAEYLSNLYLKSYFNADYICFVPMTEKAKKKRGYNQGELLAKKVGERVNVKVLEVIEKVNETTRQAKLNREQRLKNLEGVFRIKSRKLVRDKTIVIIDDVSTTGATAENIARKLKSAGAKTVYLLTIASVAPKIGY